MSDPGTWLRSTGGSECDPSVSLASLPLVLERVLETIRFSVRHRGARQELGTPASVARWLSG